MRATTATLLDVFSLDWVGKRLVQGARAALLRRKMTQHACQWRFHVCQYANGDWQAVQGELSKDMATTGEYIQTCKLTLSPTKKVSTIFPSTTR